MNKKKILSLALVVCVAAILAIGGTLAYFTDTDSADNVFTVGNVKIDLVEEQWDTEEKEDVYPGEALAKDPVVKNLGDNPCFVRVKVEGLDCLAPAGLITFETGNVSGALGEGWVDGEDGYYYYTEVVTYEGDTYNTDLDTETTALFDHIRMPKDLTNGFDGEYDIKVSAEAVQAQGACSKWSDVKNMKLAAIQTWFTTCGF